MMKKLNTLDNLSLQIIVDCSQLRLDPKDIQNYLNKGYIVTMKNGVVVKRELYSTYIKRKK